MRADKGHIGTREARLEDKIIAMLCGAAGAIAGGLINYGVFRERFRQLIQDVRGLKAEHVAKTEYEQELLAIHKRIDRHSRESDERSKETQKLLSDIGKDLSELKGFMRGRFGDHESHRAEQ